MAFYFSTSSQKLFTAIWPSRNSANGRRCFQTHKANVVRVAEEIKSGDVWNGGETDHKYENAVINRLDNFCQ